MECKWSTDLSLKDRDMDSNFYKFRSNLITCDSRNCQVLVRFFYGLGRWHVWCRPRFPHQGLNYNHKWRTRSDRVYFLRQNGHIDLQYNGIQEIFFASWIIWNTRKYSYFRLDPIIKLKLTRNRLWKYWQKALRAQKWNCLSRERTVWAQTGRFWFQYE